MPRTFPGLARRPLWQREAFEKALTLGPPLGLELWSLAHGLGFAAGLKAAWLGASALVTVLRAARKDADTDLVTGPRALYGCLRVLQAAALASKGLDPKEPEAMARLRVTVHRVDHVRERIEQVTPYVGGPERADAKAVLGRARSSRSGVVGRAIYGSRPVHFQRSGSFDDYVDEMRRLYFMTQPEALELDSSRFSHFAVPLGVGGTDVAAVLFLDSSDVSFFDDTTQNVLVSLGAAIKEYVAKDLA